ncbi:metal-dependent transcriptional regulator [Paraflavitalea sp. CAU 1676]|uniref:metal-dependent transcriptional regulator n=1 Tax=Paraflavitalea sp. CAU 1676 TaxID=3032598 RepID=UPI0023DA3CE3|nr:metal-dependent transcriptional regulator [Paraflavitalea sp. CAU 1676]MDF2190000.1 metal-dependent transcriptional regulator [Paraflavitalea sp. CAU 1676]
MTAAPKYSSSTENYLKAIFHLQKSDGIVTTNDVANELQTRPASVTDMLKKLKAQKLLLYEKYKGFKLSNEGRKVALQIIRKHRLWEFFLVEKLNFGWDEVHEIAEELEHISSKKLIDRLDEYLGFPKSDPHGDPIPDSNGKFTLPKQVDLLNLPLNKVAEVSSIGDQSAEMLELLGHKGIALGTKVEVKKKFAFDNSLELKFKNQLIVTVSEHVAKNVFVKYDE